MAEAFLESIGIAELLPLEYQKGYAAGQASLSGEYNRGYNAGYNAGKTAGYNSGYSAGYSAGQSAASGTITAYSLSASNWTQYTYTATGTSEVDNQKLYYQELNIRSTAKNIILCAIQLMDVTTNTGSSDLTIWARTDAIYGVGASISTNVWPSIWSSTSIKPPATITDRYFHPKLSKGEVTGLNLRVDKSTIPRTRGIAWIVFEFSSDSKLRCFLTDFSSTGDSSSSFKTFLSYMKIFAI